jgi:1-phosphofructokinase family hexose kinase
MTFPRLALDEVNRAVHVVDSPAGKSINVAKVLRTLGTPVVATGFLGGDPGQRIRAALSLMEITHDFVEVVPATRICITLLDQFHHTATELVEESPAVTEDAYIQLLDRLAMHLPNCSMLVLSGTLTLGAPQDFYLNCTLLANRHDVPTLLDTRGEPLTRALSARPMLVKPNRAELASTYQLTIDTDAQLHQAMKRLISDGAEWAIVTEGRRGATLTDGRSFWKVTPPVIRPLNPIGSGDAFTAGLASEILRGVGVPEACLLATAAATANALTDQSGVVNLDDVSNLLPQVTVEKVRE